MHVHVRIRKHYGNNIVDISYVAHVIKIPVFIVSIFHRRILPAGIHFHFFQHGNNSI